MEMLNIPSDRGIRMVQPELIIRVEAISNYSKIFFINSRPLTVAKVLQWFEDRLQGGMFARVHRSHLVNTNFVKEINGHNQCGLLLTNGEHIVMSRRKKVALRHPCGMANG